MFGLPCRVHRARVRPACDGDDKLTLLALGLVDGGSLQPKIYALLTCHGAKHAWKLAAIKFKGGMPPLIRRGAACPVKARH